MTFDRERMKQTASQLASQGIFIGTSSWKYSGWCGQLYTQERYQWNGKFAEKRFENGCLEEYAEVFKTVCVDAAYYKFPEARFLERLASQVPEDFQFTFKVTDEITIKRFTNLPRFGARAGQPNPNFLNAGVFRSAFLEPMTPFRNKVGVLIFEFSRFYRTDFARGREFMETMDAFLAQLPHDWRYGVELRNPQFLHPDYFAMLGRHGVAHVYNSWTAMPPVSEQLILPGAQPNPGLSVARFLLRPGRKYEQAVQQFGPYDQVREVNEEARGAGAALIRRAAESGGREKAFIYVNNRLEGNALASILAMIELWQETAHQKAAADQLDMRIPGTAA
jgi:uncharacterized protein YecE (DUF72 family)